MRKNKLAILFVYVCLLSIVAIPQISAFAEGLPSKIIKVYGKSFLEEKASGLRVMHLRGSAYERGYQRAML
jgi:hypothetical protein